MITGTLARIGENLVDRLHGRRAPLGDNCGQWLTFVSGTAARALSYAPFQALAFMAPAVVAALMSAVTAMHPGFKAPENPKAQPGRCAT